MDHALRRRRLAALLPEAGVDALWVTRLSNVRYLTGFTGSNGQVLIAGDRARLFTDGRYAEQASHEAADVERTIYLDGKPPLVGAPTEGLRRIGFEAPHTTWTAWNRLQETTTAASIDLVPTTGLVERLRRVKDAEELVLLRRAQEATDAAFDAVVLGGLLRAGVTEREIGWALERAMRDAGAEGMAFDPIVGFGPSAAEPHHHPGDRALERGDVVKLDFGARVEGYHADMTRTVALGDPGARVREIRDLVYAAQTAGIEAVRVGARLRDVDAASRAVLADAGHPLPHGLGHGTGLDIHEDPFLRADDEALAAGTVVTVEPGVYIPGLGGARIEDMIEVTEDGPRGIPRTSKELLLL